MDYPVTLQIHSNGVWITQIDCILINVESSGSHGWTCDGIEVEDGRIMFAEPLSDIDRVILTAAREAMLRNKQELGAAWLQWRRDRADCGSVGGTTPQ